ncbi:electron transfer flavoprotein [Citrobacter cronae]|uniref:electron transfer flavoprotein n=1 Tax=Citrobacter cronae TaxID=1748967 RepID=UPI0020791C3C|nr:electron transfer flavoprotein [Citrobacter cronae]MCM8842661.1 electron transfer flavoprotein [Citrobacter cronae]
MKLLACYKLVAEEQDITITADRTLDTTRAGEKISPFDLNAIEEAVQLAGENDEVIALCVGGQALDNAKLRKDLLSRGPHGLYLVRDERLSTALAHETSRVIAAAAKKIGFDLLLCGEGSGDLYAQQTGLRVGEMLHLPTVNAVSHIEIHDGYVTVERTLENEIEIIDVPLPAVLCVTSDINEPRIPSMKAILGAGKKPVTQWTADDIGWSPVSPEAEMVNIYAPQQAERKHIIIEGDGAEDIARLAEHLNKVLN